MSKQSTKTIAAPAMVHPNGVSTVSLFKAFKETFRLEFEVGRRTTSSQKNLASTYGDKVEIVPGRESHTADLLEFDSYCQKIDALKRDRKQESPAGAKTFWSYVISILDKAVPIGFEGDPDASIVLPKGPSDYQKLFRKMKDTEILNPINPVAISKASGVPIGDVLTELLFATKVGLVSMKWSPFCERCMAPVCTLDWGKDDPPIHAYCQGCRYRNTIECMSKIKVLFVLTQEVFYVLSQNFQCTASESIMEVTEAKVHIPATSSGSGWRVYAGCGEEEGLMYRPALPPGLYRMHCPLICTQNYLRVKREAKENDEPFDLEIHHSELVVRPGDEQRTLTAPHGKIHFNIHPDMKSDWIFWVTENVDDDNMFFLPPEERGKFMTAFEVLEQKIFQELFKDQIDEMVYDAVSQMKLSDR